MSEAKDKNIETAVAAEATPAQPTASDEVVAKFAAYDIDGAKAIMVMNELGIESLSDLLCVEVEDLTRCGIKLIKARRLVNDLKCEAKKAAVPAPTEAETRAIQSQFEALLPQVPTDASWLSALKNGGVLKIDDSSYIAAIRAALADRVGLYGIPEALTKAMEKFSDETEEQLDPAYFALRKSLIRRNYGDIFSAIDGLDGNYITDARRKEFFKRIHDVMWPAIAESFRSLDAWYQSYRASATDPSMFLMALSGGLSGAPAGLGMAALPDTSILHDAGESLVNAINRVFRGTGVQIAAALAYDANNIRASLEDNRLPAMVGAKNRELMLKKIGINVSSNYVRLEQNLVKYVLGFVKHDGVTSDAEASYFIALWNLGNQINWSELGVSVNSGGITGITGKNVL